MHNIKNMIPFLGVLLSLFSCTGKNNDLKKYYFPYVNFIEPKTYMYVATGNINDIMYMHLETSVNGTDTFMTTSTFINQEDRLQLVQVSVEKIAATGTTLEEVYIVTDTLAKGTLKKKEICSWEKNAKKSWTWSFTYTLDSFTTREIIKTRQLASIEEATAFSDIEEPHIVFKDAYLINTHSSNRTKTVEEYTYSCYAETKGMMVYDVMQAGVQKKRYLLKKVMDEKEWIELYKKYTSNKENLWPLFNP